MAKAMGVTGVSITCNTHDISNDVETFDVTLSGASVDWETIAQAAKDRTIGLGDFKATMNCLFDAATNKVFALFSSGFGTAFTFVFTYPGPNVLTVTAQHTSFPLKLAANRKLTVSIPLELTGGVQGAWS